MRLLTEFGMGTSLRRGDYTQAAKRAVQDALWHNSINLAELFGFEKEAMRITVDVGVQNRIRWMWPHWPPCFPMGPPRLTCSAGGWILPAPKALKSDNYGQCGTVCCL